MFGYSIMEMFSIIEKENNIKISKFQKLLLSEVATVEQMLSIIVNSPITVEVISREIKSNAIIREVVLRDNNKHALIRAVTRYNPQFLPFCMELDLMTTNEGIGASIKKHEVSTFRKIIGMGYDKKLKILYRKYRIIKDSVCLFEIYEEFNINLFK